MKPAALALLLSFSFSAPAYAAETVYATGRLANGFSYHIFKVPSAGKKLVTRLNVGVGAADENAGEEGIAHITEHMVFQPSPQNPEGLSKQLMRGGWVMGGHFNARTTYNDTRYMLTPPRGVKQLGEVLQVYRQILEPKAFAEGDWAKEKQVVLSEWRQQQTLQNRLNRRRHELTYKGARQGRYAPIGRLEAIQGASMKTASDFHKRWYAGNNAVLVVAGDVSIDRTVAEVQQIFGSLPAKELATRKAEEYEPVLQNGWHVGEIRDQDNTDSKLSLVFRFRKQPAQAYEEQSYQRLLDNFAAYIVNRRIGRSGQAVELKMDTLGRNTGALVLHSETAPEQQAEMLEVLRSLRQDILDNPATNEELAEYRKAVHSNLLPQAAALPDNLDKIVGMADDTLLDGLPLPTADIRTADRSQLYRINAKAVNQRIADWFNAPDKMIQVQPAAAEKIGLPALSKLDEAVKRPSENTADTSRAAPEFAESPAGKITAERRDAATDTLYLRLGNGDTATIRRLDAAGRKIHFKAVSRSGWFGGSGNVRYNRLAADVVSRAAPQGMSRTAFNQWKQQAGIAKYSLRLDGYHQTTDAQALEGALQPLLQLYRQYQTAPGFGGLGQAAKREEAAFKVAQNTKAAKLRQMQEEMRYGRSLMPSENPFAAIDEAALKRQWQQLAAAPTDYYFVSSLPSETVKQAVLQYLASIPRQTAATSVQPLQTGRHWQQAAAGRTDGAEIQAVSWQPLDAPNAATLSEIRLLNHFANARLKEELRSRNQSVYSVKFEAVPNFSQKRIETTLTFNTAANEAQSAWQAAQKVLHNLPDSIGFSQAAAMRKLAENLAERRKRSPDAMLDYMAAMGNSDGLSVPEFSRSSLRETAKLLWSAQNEQVLAVMPEGAGE
ncbi:M16 family metallopeptidase [Neisseria chenwenguii]|uniref:M16 family metallopeptidase n=1 Tax=Neisseria chenwenguii TaxID=1853278 RepID=UPI000F4E5D25|nr:pitrilysin family protein [Neisseria chenwenguii]ROV55851.1 insulinase family protein [Neisseria chenwenguii]